MSVVERTRQCAGCPVTFEPRRPNQQFHDERCRGRARVRRHRHPEPERLADLVWTLRARGEIDGVDALILLIAPPAEVLERLGAAA